MEQCLSLTQTLRAVLLSILVTFELTGGWTPLCQGREADALRTPVVYFAMFSSNRSLFNNRNSFERPIKDMEAL